MAATETALVVAMPGDDVAALERKVLQARARHVQALVPEGVSLLQQPEAAARLAHAARAAGIDLLLVTTDPDTLRAARGAGLLAMEVRGARVLVPEPRQPAAPPATPPAAPAVAPPRAAPVTTILPPPPAAEAPATAPPTAEPAAPRLPVATPTVPLAAREEDALPHPLAAPTGPEPPAAARPPEPEPRDVATGGLARDLRAGDAAFLQALDDLDAAPTRRAPDESDDEPIETLISLYNADKPHTAPAMPLADQLRRQAHADADDDIAAALNSIDAEPAPRARTPPLPTPRVRPEDIELTDEDRRRMAARRPGAAPPPRPAPRPARTYADPEGPAAATPASPRPARRGQPLRWIIPLIALVALAALVLALWLNRGGELPNVGLPGFAPVTISVSPPPSALAVEPVTDLALPLAEPGAGQPGDQAATAIESAVLAADSSIAAEGTVTAGVLAPSGTAAGVVTVLNQNAQGIALPAGTEFVAIQPDGQEVPFLSSAEVVVPPATTADQGAQIVTTRGSAQVPVTARSPGSASNVGPNTIRRMTIPGGPSFEVVGGLLRVTHEAISGGSEAEVRVVGDADVQRVLAGALEQLDAGGRQQLETQAAARGLAVELTTILPRREGLEQLQGFDLTVTPGVGETLDPNNPRFTVSVSARYSALATPPGRPLVGDGGQLSDVFPEQLRRAGLLEAGDCRAPAVTDWRWDGQTLFVDGTIGPDPRCTGISPAAERQVREAVRGRTRAEAAAALDALVAEGVIGGYTLPDDAESLPDQDYRIRVNVQGADG